MNKLLQRIEALEGRVKPQAQASPFLIKALELLAPEEISGYMECGKLIVDQQWERIRPQHLTTYLRAEQLRAEIQTSHSVFEPEDPEEDPNSLRVQFPQYIVQLSVDPQDINRVIVQKTEGCSL